MVSTSDILRADAGPGHAMVLHITSGTLRPVAGSCNVPKVLAYRSSGILESVAYVT